MRYFSIDEVLQSPGLTWEELCERAEKEIKGRREKYRKLQAKRTMMREKLRWDATKTEGVEALEEQNEESVMIEEGKQMGSANDETSLQSEVKAS
ncbi:uncharacterized protein FTOL_11223 [Fusarium torulosum]|uniref:Uncharacterized protein n=1 Tax=Fusarium torulosum TaxID=33205 RepID=A0AAE8MJK7_9HYPO|nr:uncharacterized protein FTOL_11223 [Fusarium torulosum]